MTNRQPRILDKRFAILLGMQILILTLIAISLFKQERSSLGDYEYLKEAGTEAQAAGVNTSAILNFEKYLERKNSSLDAKSRSQLAMNLGDLYEQEGAWEKALGQYYQAKNLDPQGKNRQDLDKRIIAILERLKKHGAAQVALSEATQLKEESDGEGEAEEGSKGKVKKGGAVVAKIGNKEIYLSEVMSALDELPEPIREKFKGANEKREFAKRYIANLLVIEKAKKMRLDEEPELRIQFERAKEQILLQKMIQQEVLSKVKKADEMDLKNYFSAHKDNYQKLKQEGKGKGKGDVTFEEVKEQVARDYNGLKQEESFQKLIEESMAGSDVTFYLDRVQ